MMSIRGAVTALITPFRDGAINKASYEADVERQIESDIGGIIACGTTAETPTLTAKECEWLVRTAVATAAGRVPVIVGTGTNSTATTIEATKAAADFGADAALVVTPYYNRPSQEGLLRHYEAVEEASELPLLLYNVPGRTGVDLLPDTVSRLSELPGIVGIKEAKSDVDRIAVLRHVTRADFKVYSGDDGTAVHAMTSGADGCMSVIANALPRDWIELCELTLRGRTAESGRLHARLQPLLEALSLETNPGPIKYLMSLVCRSHSPEVRLPLLPVKSATATRIRTALDTYLAWRGPDSRFPDAA